MALQTTVHLIPSPGELRVRLTVRNPSNRYEIFSQMSCSWESAWRCDREGVSLRPHSCRKNTPHTIILEPGASFSEEAWPVDFRGLAPGRVTFRFGLKRRRNDFTSQEIEQIYKSPNRYSFFSRTDIAGRYKRDTDIFWSPPVTVVIRKAWITG